MTRSLGEGLRRNFQTLVPVARAVRRCSGRLAYLGAIILAGGTVSLRGASAIARLPTDRGAADPRCILGTGQNRAEFNLASPADLKRLQHVLELRMQAAADHEAAGHRGKKTERRGLRELQRRTRGLLEGSQLATESELQNQLLETAAAVNNLERPPIPRRVDFFETPFVFLKRFSRPVGQGNAAAANLQPGDSTDLSLLDPQPSSFWTKVRNISGQDLYHGFGRTNFLLPAGSVCTYAGPKESFGRNPGFEVECNGTELKLKFAEVSSEPFAARIFDALGYHTDPTDYAPQVRVRYSRRILLEFNRRKPLTTHFTFLGFVPLFTLQLQERYDPFSYFTAVVLTNGTRWTSAEFKRQLFRDPRLPHPEAWDANFRPEVEAAVDYLQTVAANVQRKLGKSIGPWDFGQLDHASRREVRGVGLLAGWLGWFDTRFDNTRLRLVERKGQPELEHFFSDLGGVLGETTGLLYARGELPNTFPWSFTRPPLWQGPHRLARPLRLTGYKPIAPTSAFAAMTLDDARWMGRLIRQLTVEQLEQALVASGFDSAQARLYLAKLLNRRARMLLDLGLAHQTGADPGALTERHFNYDPTRDGAVRVRMGCGSIEAPVGTNQIINGSLLPIRSRAGAPRAATLAN